MIDLTGKNFAIFGVANDKSIAWAIVQQLMACGGIPILCSHPMMQARVEKLAAAHRIGEVILCDVESAPGSDPEVSLERCFQKLAMRGPFHGFVHSIGFSDTAQLEGRFLDTTRENFMRTMNISCFSLIEICKRAQPLMPDGGSILTLTFDASRGSYPNYNVMAPTKAALETSVIYAATELGEHNIRVNAIAASPENTLAARGIGNFRAIGAFAEAQSPMARRATVEEIGMMSAFLLSPASSGTTGQTIFVDCGSSITTMPPARNAGLMATAMKTVDDIFQKQKGGAS